jgi:hypothetical protein
LDPATTGSPAAAAASVPFTEPLSWLETGRLGCCAEGKLQHAIGGHVATPADGRPPFQKVNPFEAHRDCSEI